MTGGNAIPVGRRKNGWHLHSKKNSSPSILISKPDFLFLFYSWFKLSFYLCCTRNARKKPHFCLAKASRKREKKKEKKLEEKKLAVSDIRPQFHGILQLVLLEDARNTVMVFIRFRNWQIPKKSELLIRSSHFSLFQTGGLFPLFAVTVTTARGKCIHRLCTGV